jgi:hypothetical protein
VPRDVHRLQGVPRALLREAADEAMSDPIDDPRMHAGIDLLRRTGQRSFQLRYSDDEQPVVWMALGEYGLDENNRPVKTGGDTHYEVAAALHPVSAVLRLLEVVLDGGKCAHCDRATGIFPELEPPTISTLMDAAICWYVFDADSARYVRGCERVKSS